MYATSLIMFTLPFFMPRFKSVIFYQRSSKIKLFLQKNLNFRALGASPQTPITKFWLRAYHMRQAHRQKIAMEGAVLGVWGQIPQPPEAQGYGSGAPNAQKFSMFVQNNSILGLF